MPRSFANVKQEGHAATAASTASQDTAWEEQREVLLKQNRGRRTYPSMASFLAGRVPCALFVCFCLLFALWVLNSVFIHTNIAIRVPALVKHSDGAVLEGARGDLAVPSHWDGSPPSSGMADGDVDALLISEQIKSLKERLREKYAAREKAVARPRSIPAGIEHGTEKASFISGSPPCTTVLAVEANLAPPPSDAASNSAPLRPQPLHGNRERTRERTDTGELPAGVLGATAIPKASQGVQAVVRNLPPAPKADQSSNLLGSSIPAPPSQLEAIPEPPAAAAPIEGKPANQAPSGKEDGDSSKQIQNARNTATQQPAGKEDKIVGEEEDDDGPIKCIAWRATSNCSFDGAREPENDRPCRSSIPEGSSGYCEVLDRRHERSGMVRRVMLMNCDSYPPSSVIKGEVTCAHAAEFATYPEESLAYRPEDSLQEIVMAPTANPTRGLVLCVADGLMISAYATIRVLREKGFRLPIELWYLPDELTAAIKIVRELVYNHMTEMRPINVDRKSLCHGGGKDKCFNVKIYAVYHSR